MTPYNSPLGAAKADRLIAALDIESGARVLDVGCGRGTFLIQILNAHSAHGLGVDIDTASLDAAREHAGAELKAGSFEFQEADAKTLALAPGSFDVALCIGSTHAFSMGEPAYSTALGALADLVRPGGRILVGEGYWKQAPDAAYLELLGDPAGIYRTHAENVELGERQGLVPLYATASNDDEWDHFEWTHRKRFELEARKTPTTPEAEARLASSRAWRDGYLKWGRSTMGFGFYIFLKP